MTDEQNGAAGRTAEGDAERGYGLQRIYIKDLSFEAPKTPEVFEGDWQPSLNVNIGTKTRAVGEDLHEVVVSVNVEARNGEEVVFLVELHQAGVFVIRGFEEEEKKKILAILCPQNLFPFARETVASLTLKGGFPQVLLQPVNFERAFFQSQQQTAGEA